MLSLDVQDINSLEEVEAVCWQMLEDAVHDRFSPMHQVVAGTVRDGLPMTRVVVLRRVDRAPGKLYFHTDMRKDLVKDILSAGVMSWLAYDKLLRSQLRLFGKTVVHHKDDLAREQWVKTSHFSKRCYLQPVAPGAISDGSNLKEDLSGFAYSPEESEQGFEHFAVVETTVDWMDWYFTHNKGNRRARFYYDHGKVVSSEWLFP